MVSRIRPLIGMTFEEVRAERTKRDALGVLGALGFEDADDGEHPNDIFHPLIGQIDTPQGQPGKHRVRRLQCGPGCRGATTCKPSSAT